MSRAGSERVHRGITCVCMYQRSGCCCWFPKSQLFSLLGGFGAPRGQGDQFWPPFYVQIPSHLHPYTVARFRYCTPVDALYFKYCTPVLRKALGGLAASNSYRHRLREYIHTSILDFEYGCMAGRPSSCWLENERLENSMSKVKASNQSMTCC